MQPGRTFFSEPIGLPLRGNAAFRGVQSRRVSGAMQYWNVWAATPCERGRFCFREVMAPESRHTMIRTRGKQRRDHAKGHRASVEAFRRILEQKFIENQNEIADAMVEAARKANTAAVREAVKLVDGIDEPEEQPQSEGVSNQIRIWEDELRQTSVDGQQPDNGQPAREPTN